MPETKFFKNTITLSPQSEPASLKFLAKLAFRTFGSPSNPAIFLPTCCGGTLSDTLPFLYSTDNRPNPILPPSDYFIIVAGLLGGSESSSPSNTPEPFHGPNFPRTTYEDNVRLQYAFCQSLGIKKLFAYIGFSMGGQQAYHMAALFPDFVENVVVLAGSGRTSWHNRSVLETLKDAILSSSDFHDGEYTEPPMKALKAMDRIFATWALSPAWYRQHSWETLGFKTLEEYLEDGWSGSGDANDMVLQLWTWQKGDISTYYLEDKGDIAKTLKRIEARVLVMPSRTDQYFSHEDSEEEVKHIKHGQFRCVESVFGHLAAGGMGTKEDTDYIAEEIQQFLLP